MIRLGLTGGIGSGKSTVADMLTDLGATLIDADALSRASTAAGGSAIDAIARIFGADFITPDGALDRDRMRALAYADPQARQRLEAIVHPLVGQAVRERTAQALASGCRCVVYDVPLLVESGRWRQQVDRVLVIDCEEQEQVQRVMARNGLSRAEVERIIVAQASRAQRLAAADAVIVNHGIDRAGLRQQVRWLWHRFGL
ncbi:MAG: dephospho-CoA kinase [Rhodoferax sp.]|nr:dephospho-CoA kinase [Rhodoferax sp.]